MQVNTSAQSSTCFGDSSQLAVTGKFTDVNKINKMHIDISNITKKYSLRHSAVSPHT